VLRACRRLLRPGGRLGFFTIVEAPGLASPGTEMQIHPAALHLHLIDLSLAVLLAAGLEGEHLGVSREML
jgi:hypothetical protein